MHEEYAVGYSRPRIFSRWWLRSREIESITFLNGLKGACHEVYVPTWAWPLEVLHILIFGSTKLKV